MIHMYSNNAKANDPIKNQNSVVNLHTTFTPKSNKNFQAIFDY